MFSFAYKYARRYSVHLPMLAPLAVGRAQILLFGVTSRCHSDNLVAEHNGGYARS